MATKDNKQTILPALIRILLYIVLVTSPVILLKVLSPRGEYGFLSEFGKALALLGFTILSLQFVISARLKWIERPFGLDMLFNFHKSMGIFAGILIIFHPVMLALGSQNWNLLLSLNLPWYILAAKFALFILLIQVLVSLFRKVIKLEFQKWRYGHNSLALLVLSIGFVHSWYTGDDLQTLRSMRFLWIGFLVMVAVAYAYSRVFRHLWHRSHPYEVTEVKQETHNVWTLKFAPPEGKKTFDYFPGQFHFITIYRDELPVEEHPFTISSTPTEKGFVSSTIKESGDYTSTIGKTKKGDKVNVQGAYGRFSYVLKPESPEYVFIAGGIGITPLMNMLRHMRNIQADKDVLLLYGNRTEDDIVFRDELSEIENGEYPNLKVVHTLSQAGDEWEGETGYIDREMIERFCEGDFENKAFYVCGPPVMMDMVFDALKSLKVPDSRIYFERFSL